MPKKNPFWLESWCELRRQAVHVFRFIGHHFHHFRWQFVAYRYILVNSNTNNIKPQPIASRISFFSIRLVLCAWCCFFFALFIVRLYCRRRVFTFARCVHSPRARTEWNGIAESTWSHVFLCALAQWPNQQAVTAHSSNCGKALLFLQLKTLRQLRFFFSYTKFIS